MFVCFSSDGRHTHPHAQWSMFLAVGTCTCKKRQFNLHRRNWGGGGGGQREKKMDESVNRRMHRQTYRQALEHFERLKTPRVFDPAPAPPRVTFS